MNMLNWSARFEEQKTCTDILLRVRKTQYLYWFWMVAAVLVTLAGVYMLLNFTETRGMIIGLFVALTGVINISLIKLWAHLRLFMYYIIWDSQNRLEAELNKSLADDI